ncbi:MULTISPECIES: serine O-acetyltransferase EpsC [Novosphingobium]|jgi:serine O-acetyltransferase|uniref:serine O-acetyltransferase EpsC n=1 Tax=Novosphingobium TaxID=165696 RepID=UPI0022F257B6|nr:serine O-acetyltransferase EpsC [Novosphingobium resinovorum]GLK44925.1 serine acetyltransferase [Novosphingobium resinovorum]
MTTEPTSSTNLAAVGNAADFWDVAGVVQELAQIRHNWRQTNTHHAEYGVESFPSRVRMAKVMDELCGALFPLRLGPDFVRLHNEDVFVTQTLQIALSRLHAQLRLELTYTLEPSDGQAIDDGATRIVLALSHQLPEIRRLLDIDIEAAFSGDPSARSLDEVLICYPGLLAIIHHRLAHTLHLEGAPLIARIISEISHSRTGIDIHPGAQVGRGFFIDHGTGVVIGETAIIGDNVRLYQGVTLGAKNFPVGDTGMLIKAIPRHPIIENDVVIYAGATILGRVTVGTGSEIGGNVWLTHDVPPFSRVFQAREQNLVISPQNN